MPAPMLSVYSMTKAAGDDVDAHPRGRSRPERRARQRDRARLHRHPDGRRLLHRGRRDRRPREAPRHPRRPRSRVAVADDRRAGRHRCDGRSTRPGSSRVRSCVPTVASCACRRWAEEEEEVLDGGAGWHWGDRHDDRPAERRAPRLVRVDVPRAARRGQQEAFQHPRATCSIFSTPAVRREPRRRRPPVLSWEDLDRFGIERGLVPVTLTDELHVRAISEHPDRLFGSVEVDPNRGMDTLGDSSAAVFDHGVVAASFFRRARILRCRSTTSGHPLYAKCVELDIPVFVQGGVPGPRVPMASQYPGSSTRSATTSPTCGSCFAMGASRGWISPSSCC